MAYLISFSFIFIVIGIAAFIKDKELSRKFIHILVGNWVFLLPLFDSYLHALIVPFLFVIINTLSYRFNIIKAMEREDDSKGTIYYSVSLFILVFLSYLFNQPMLTYIGVLTMAYGDGLAALLGPKYGKTLLYHKKSVVGSLTVVIISFIVTFLSLTYFSEFKLVTILVTTLLTALFSGFIELVSENGLDNLTLPIGSGIVATLIGSNFSSGLIIYLVFSILLVTYAYKKKSITLDGIVVALITAIILYTLGKAPLAYALLLFFIFGSGVSKIANKVKKKFDPSTQRNYKQVLSNSLPVSLLTLVSAYTNNPNLLLLGIAVFAGATADTFSSELGTLTNQKVFSPLSGKKVPKGLSGGVTWFGLLAGLIGSVLLSLITLYDYGFKGFIFSTLLGFTNSLIDSVLGITLQRKYLDENNELTDKGDGPVVQGLSWMSNNKVNLFSLSLTLILGYLILH